MAEVRVAIKLNEGDFVRENITECEGRMADQMGFAIGQSLASIVSPWAMIVIAHAILEIDEGQYSKWDDSTKECSEAEKPLIEAASSLIDWWKKRKTKA